MRAQLIQLFALLHPQRSPYQKVLSLSPFQPLTPCNSDVEFTQTSLHTSESPSKMWLLWWIQWAELMTSVYSWVVYHLLYLLFLDLGRRGKKKPNFNSFPFVGFFFGHLSLIKYQLALFTAHIVSESLLCVWVQLLHLLLVPFACRRRREDDCAVWLSSQLFDFLLFQTLYNSLANLTLSIVLQCMNPSSFVFFFLLIKLLEYVATWLERYPTCQSVARNLRDWRIPP